jgi:thiamine pyrophosphate-dependent acetolactate synthase large subunit-like protein
MKGIEALEEMISQLDDQPVVHANGFICRESFTVKDRPGNFYMIGSMGLASSIGLGVALARPDKKTIIFDGDGNVLMSMGTLAMIAASAPKNLVHVALDNEVYESTGSQATLSASVPLDEVARSAGYPLVMKITSKEDLGPAFKKALSSDGPSFLLVKVEPSFDRNTGRVTHTPEEIKARFMETVAK